jgi:hypothetical protein
MIHQECDLSVILSFSGITLFYPGLFVLSEAKCKDRKSLWT